MPDTHAAAVHFRTPDGRRVSIEPGHFIGRSVGAALRLNEPGVSEAHALVSLRGSTLKLLALRGRFIVHGALVGETDLAPGLEITLAVGVTLRVESVRLPEAVLGLLGEGLPRQALPALASLDAATPHLEPGFHAERDALIWSDGEHFFLRRPDHPDAEATPGLAFHAAGRRFTFVAVPLSDGGVPRTLQEAACDQALTILARYDSVHIHQGPTTAVISGQPARMLSELAIMAVPADWDVVARELWHNESDLGARRQRHDRVLGRLRARLRDAGVRADLLRSDGAGRLELVLGPHDRVVDET